MTLALTALARPPMLVRSPRVRRDETSPEGAHPRRHQDLETDAHNELRKIVRSVDKKIQLQVMDGPSPQDPLLSIQLVQGTLQATVEMSVEEIRRALENDRDRTVLRERLKRAHERLWFPTKPAPLFSTKAIRPGSESFAHFRPSGGRR